MPEGWRQQRIPRDLAVEVRVDVDESGRDQETLGVDLLAAEIVDLADGGDDAVVDGDICQSGSGAGAVDDLSVADNEIVHVSSFSS